MKQTYFFRSPDTGNGNDGSNKPQTDNTKLATTDTVYVSPDGGTTNEAFPVPGTEYDFCVDVSNTATLSSGPFYVEFSLDNGNGNTQTFDFKQDAGLDTGQSVKAVSHFGQFTEDDLEYTLSACIFSPSAPEKPINCAGTFGFNPHLSPHNTDTSGSSSGNSSGNSTDGPNTTDASNTGTNDSQTDSNTDSPSNSPDTTNN